SEVVWLFAGRGMGRFLVGVPDRTADAVPERCVQIQGQEMGLAGDSVRGAGRGRCAEGDCRVPQAAGQDSDRAGRDERLLDGLDCRPVGEPDLPALEERWNGGLEKL